MTQATPSAASAGVGAARLWSDDRLARRATQGDRRAFAAIYRRYHQDLYRYCAAIVGNPEDAQDALQNTMVKVLRALPGEDRHVQLKPWLYRIAHNESIELLRHRHPVEQIDPELAAAGPSAAEAADLRQRLRRLIGDLDELPDRQRGALVMRELAGLSFEQIAGAFDTSPAVARQTLYEARAGLQQMSQGREMRCEEICRALSDGDRRVIRRRDIRAHLRACPACRAFRDGISDRGRDFAAISPLPAAAAVGLLHGILGGANGASGVGLGGATGAGAAGKALAGSALVKSAATVAVVVAVGVSAADRSGLIHVLPGGGQERHVQGSPSGSSRGAATPRSGNETGSAAAAKGARPQRQPSAESAVAGTAASERSSHGVADGGHGSARSAHEASSHGNETAAAHSPAGHSHPTHGHRSVPTPPQAPSAKGHGASKGATHASHPAHPSPSVAPTPPEAASPETVGGAGQRGEH